MCVFLRFCICFVQLDESNANRLVLRSITAETAGRFRCEVSAEAPSFETVSGHADMTVVRKCHYFATFSLLLERHSVGADLTFCYISARITTPCP